MKLPKYYRLKMHLPFFNKHWFENLRFYVGFRIGGFRFAGK